MDNTNLGIEQAIYELIGCSDILLLTFLRSSSCDFITFYALANWTGSSTE